MHIHKSSFVGGFRILVDHRTPAISAGLGCGFGTRVVSDVLPWRPVAELNTGDVVDPSGTGTGDNISGESGFGECAGLRTCLLYTSPSPRDEESSRMPSSA